MNTSDGVIRQFKKDHEAEKISGRWDEAELYWCEKCGCLLTIHPDISGGYLIQNPSKGEDCVEEKMNEANT